ncbi:RsiV family protein [Vreelandella sp. EE22]
MQRIQGGVLAVSALVLAGCQSLQDQPVEPYSMVTLAQEKYFVASDCQGEECSSVRVSALEFPKSEALTRELQDRLIALGSQLGPDAAQADSDLPTTWERYANGFFEQARQNSAALAEPSASNAVLEADVVARHNDLLVIELNGYTYLAGQAHGMPMTAFMVIDEREARIVAPGEMIREDREDAFQTALSEAHRRWLADNDKDGQFADNWPFTPSDNIAPLERGWQVKYNVYDMAPYSEGQPTLLLPNEALSGIAKPRFLAQ